MIAKSKYIDSFFVVFFLLIITLPVFIQISGLEKNMINFENRKKTDFPKVHLDSISNFINSFDSYYKDNFGLRNVFATFYLHFKFNVFHESPQPEKVIVGEDDFLFLGKNFSNVINESYGQVFFTEKDLVFKKDRLLRRKKWLADNNIAFYVAIVPNKHTLYKEKFPFNYSYKTTRKKQFLDFIKEQTNLNIIDLEQFLRPKKKRHLLTNKLDSHWNDYGAFYAYQAIMDRIVKDFPVKKLELTAYKVVGFESGGDMSGMLNLSITLPNIHLESKIKTNITRLDVSPFYTNSSVNESRFSNPEKKYKVLFLRDSFTGAMIPFFNQTFGECTYIWSHRFDKELILKEKPDIVVFEIIERYLENI